MWTRWRRAASSWIYRGYIFCVLFAFIVVVIARNKCKFYSNEFNITCLLFIFTRRCPWCWLSSFGNYKTYDWKYTCLGSGMWTGSMGPCYSWYIIETYVRINHHLYSAFGCSEFKVFYFAGHVNVAPRHLTAEAETLLSATLIHEVC
jgi:hypothetical protein